MSRASSNASDYAAKKKAQMEHAVALRAQRAGHVPHPSSLMHLEKRGDGDISIVGGMEVECQSIGSNTEKIAIRRPAADRKTLQPMISSSAQDSRFSDANENGYLHGFCKPPGDPKGVQVDLSDRPLLCGSFSESKGEAILGGSDHALYSVAINDDGSKKGPKVVKMYSKKCGHTDWVTSVAHISDGRVISASMDGKLCLWDAKDRSHCVDLLGAHTKSVSKIVSSARTNTALSCSYDTNVVLWHFDELDSDSTTGRSRIGASAAAKPKNDRTKFNIMSGHKEAVVDCALGDSTTAISGDRKGGIIMWDLTTGAALRVISSGHRGSITQLLATGGVSNEDGSESGSHMFISAGVDGMVRLWDVRDDNKKPVLEVPAHASIITEGGRTGMSGAAISCLAPLSTRGGGPIPGVVTGGADSIVCLLDSRMSLSIVERWEHHRTGIYSLHTIDDNCILSGDGAGMMHCYSTNFTTCEGKDAKSGGLKYGLGCSNAGAVKTIGRIGNKIITGNEDGKALILSY